MRCDSGWLEQSGSIQLPAVGNGCEHSRRLQRGRHKRVLADRKRIEACAVCANVCGQASLDFSRQIDSRGLSKTKIGRRLRQIIGIREKITGENGEIGVARLFNGSHEIDFSDVGQMAAGQPSSLVMPIVRLMVGRCCDNERVVPGVRADFIE